MTRALPEVADSLDWGVATRAMPGEVESGDLHLVRCAEGGLCIAVVDGLGHGGEARTAARIAVATLERFADEPVSALVQRCHEALTGTRGVVMSVAKLDPARDLMTWVGLGNVEGLLVRGDSAEHAPRTSLVTRGGIVGSTAELPSTRPWVIPVERGDILVFATDGIGTAFRDDVAFRGPPQAIADLILARYCRGTDDALVLVARYLGGK